MPTEKVSTQRTKSHTAIVQLGWMRDDVLPTSPCFNLQANHVNELKKWLCSFLYDLIYIFFSNSIGS